MERLSGVRFLPGFTCRAFARAGSRDPFMKRLVYERSGTRFEMPRVVSCEMFTKVCAGRINYFKIS